MKKLAALLMALVMVLSVSALAETGTEINNITWDAVVEMMETNHPGISEQGQFVRLEDVNLQIWLPNGLSQKESEGSLYYFADEDDSHAVSVFIEDAPEGMDPTDPAALAAFVQEKYTPDEVDPAVVNGIYCVGYTLGEAPMKQACMTYGTDQGQLIHFVIEPVNDDGESMETLAVNMIAASIQGCE